MEIDGDEYDGHENESLIEMIRRGISPVHQSHDAAIQHAAQIHEAEKKPIGFHQIHSISMLVNDQQAGEAHKGDGHARVQILPIEPVAVTRTIIEPP